MVETLERPRAAEPAAVPAGRTTAVLLGVAAAFAAVSAVGYRLTASGVRLHLGVLPLFGAFRFRPTIGLVPTVLVAAAFVTVGPRLAATARFRTVMVGSGAALAAWSVALATATGWHGLTDPLRGPYDYWADVPRVRQLGLGRYVATYVERLAAGPVHAQGHPPGLLVLYGLLDRVGLSGRGWAATAVIVIGSTTAPAVLLTARVVAGEAAARRAAPFLVLAPLALFVATTGDAVFMALAAWAVALLALAVHDRRAGLGAAAGAVGALTLYFTYGLVPLLASLGAGVLWRARAPARPTVGAPTPARPAAGVLVGVALGAAAVVAVWTAAGFWWLDGLRATHHFYGLRAGNDRPYGYFLLADLVVFALMLGPAGVAALLGVRRSAVAPLVIAALVAVALADLSGLSKSEVERIWLPFMPWVLLATATLPARRARAWLAAQATLTIALQLTIAWPW